MPHCVEKYGVGVVKRPVTQLDLAQRLGVTQMTVSHAISGKGRMTPETRERVLALASELGYRPNGMARRVQEGRYRGLALLGSATRPAYNIWDQDFHISVGTMLIERSWHLTESWLPGEGLADPTIVAGLLDRMMADAVLVHDVGEQPPVVEALLASHRVPTVWVNTGRRGDSVDFADEAGATTAVQHLLAQGYRRPALLMACDPAEPDQHVSADLRVRGWTAGCTAAGVQPRIVWPATGRNTDGLSRFLAELLSSPDRPDAVACYSYKELFAARIIAGDLQLRVGRDVGFMSFAKPADVVYDRAYTVCGLDYPLLGREAVAMAWRRLESGKAQQQVLVPEAIVRGGSTTSRTG